MLGRWGGLRGTSPYPTQAPTFPVWEARKKCGPRGLHVASLKDLTAGRLLLCACPRHPSVVRLELTLLALFFSLRLF